MRSVIEEFIEEFLAKMEDSDYPQVYGPWIGINDFDPPFTLEALRAAAACAVIELDDERRRFRLTKTALDYKNAKH